MPEPSKRIVLLDEIRGFSVVVMVLYHLIFDLAFLYNVDPFVQIFSFFEPLQPIIPFFFIGISGIVAKFSRNLLKRGLILCGVAAVITLVTIFAIPEFPVYFGVIHQLSFCMVVYALARPLLEKIPRIWGIAIFLLLFLLTFHVSGGYMGFGRFTISVAALLSKSLVLYPLGLSSAPLSVSDYFPILPWFFLYLAGTYLGSYAIEGRFPAWTKKSRVPAFSWIGRQALVIYCAHQPVIYGLLALLAAVGVIK